MGICVSINDDMCLQFKCKSRKSGTFGCFITINDLSKAIETIENKNDSVSVSSSSNRPNKYDLYDYLFKNREFFIYDNVSQNNMKYLKKTHKRMVLDDFFNNRIGFKIFYTKDDFIKEVSNLNTLKQNCQGYIDDYTTLYNVNNNFAFMLNKYKNKSHKKNDRGIKITFKRYIKTGEPDDNIYIIMYKNCKSSLSKLLLKDNKQTIENFNVEQFMNNITPIIRALHTSNKAHMDLKPDNIVYCNTDYLCNNKTPCFKIIDFSIFDLNMYNINEITIKQFKELLTKSNRTYDEELLITNIFSFSNTLNYLLPDIISLFNLKNKDDEKYERIKYINYLKIPKDLYTIDDNKLSYLFKKSDEYAIALILNQIKLIKYSITKNMDETFIPYIVNLLNTDLYFRED